MIEVVINSKYVCARARVCVNVGVWACVHVRVGARAGWRTGLCSNTYSL